MSVAAQRIIQTDTVNSRRPVAIFLRPRLASADMAHARTSNQRDSTMKQSTIFGLVVTTLVAMPALAQAGDKVADLKGKWVGKSHTIVVGGGGHWPAGKGTFDNPGLAEKNVVIEIKGQDQRRFWGVTTLSGNGETTIEPFIGSLSGHRSRELVIVDTDGYFNGEVRGNTLSFCYAHTGGKTESAVVSCSQATRAR